MGGKNALPQQMVVVGGGGGGGDSSTVTQNVHRLGMKATRHVAALYTTPATCTTTHTPTPCTSYIIPGAYFLSRSNDRKVYFLSVKINRRLSIGVIASVVCADQLREGPRSIEPDRNGFFLAKE